MVPRTSMTQRWPFRPWRSQRKMYVVIYRGALRRRMRRLVRSRVFNNARTATRNLDLPLAIGDPIATQLFLLPRRILASAWRPQRWAFSGIRLCGQGSFCFQSGVQTRFWSNCIKCLRYIHNILIFWLNLVP
jgi:hypothetical protein